MKKLILSCFLLPAFSTLCFAQMHGNFSLGAALPLNDFKENTTTTGFGVNLNFYFPPKKTVPVFIGIGFGYYLFGSNSQELHEDVEVSANGQLISTIPIDLRVETTNNLVNGFISFRYKAPFKVVQPYIEAKGGFNYLFTTTTVYDDTKNKLFTEGKENNEINSRTPSSGFTYAYGMEAGVIIKPWKQIGINVGAGYLYGGRTEYYDKSQTSQWQVSFSGQSGTFNPSNPDPNTIDLSSDAGTPRKSITDMLIISLGVTYLFPEKRKNKK